MKKLVVLVFFVLAAAGCGAIDKESAAPAADRCMEKAPDWAADKTYNTGLSAIGYAKIISPAGSQFAYFESIVNAREEMERSLEIKVYTVLENFIHKTGIGSDQTVSTMASSVSKQIADKLITDLKPKAVFQSPCGEMYVLLHIKPNIIQGAVRESVRTAYRNEDTLWQEFQSEKAVEELDAAIAYEFP